MWRWHSDWGIVRASLKKLEPTHFKLFLGGGHCMNLQSFQHSETSHVGFNLHFFHHIQSVSEEDELEESDEDELSSASVGPAKASSCLFSRDLSRMAFLDRLATLSSNVRTGCSPGGEGCCCWSFSQRTNTVSSPISGGGCCQDCSPSRYALFHATAAGWSKNRTS